MNRRVSPSSRVLLVLLLVALGIGGCQTASAPAEGPTATAPPVSTATPIPSPTATPTPSPTPTPTPTATPTATPTPTAAPSPTPTPVAATFRWVWSEAELTALAQEQVRQQPDLPVDPDTVYVDLVPGEIRVGGTVRLGFFRTGVEAVITLSLVDGKPVPTVEAVLAGGNPVPGFLQDQLMEMAQPYLDEWAQAELSYVVEAIEITDDSLVLEGRFQ